jgi:uncharacterized heparinase superfamily protein
MGRFARRMRLDMLVQPIAFWRAFGGTGCQVLIAAPDLRTADPVIAADIESGRFVFAGQSVEAGNHSPFIVIPPSDDWLRQLHGFGWLRHLRVSESDMAQSKARIITEFWLHDQGEAGDIAWEPAVASRRILSLLSQSTLILRDADHDFYRRFVRSLLRQARQLRSSLSSIEVGVIRLQAIIAITMTGLSLSNQDKLTRFGLERLDQELEAQILPDGGHVSRNPAALISVLADLLPLRQAMIARGLNPSARLLRAIERMMPMLRFFRHSDGSFCHFNGMALSTTDLTATVLAYDETLGRPVMSAGYSGYERIEAGDSVLIVDAGKPPAIAASQDAHASTLAMEFSSGPQLLIVNCGAPANRHGELRRASRVTAAHSTAILNDESSSLFSGPEPDAQIVSGPRQVECKRQALADGSTCLAMSHDGYVRPHGWLHTRFLALSPDGLRLNGVDDFALKTSEAAVLPFLVRYHIHPAIRISAEEGEMEARLILPRGETWQFKANRPVAIEESLYMSDTFGSRPTEQIVVASQTGGNSAVEWSLYRLD